METAFENFSNRATFDVLDSGQKNALSSKYPQKFPGFLFVFLQYWKIPVVPKMV